MAHKSSGQSHSKSRAGRLSYVADPRSDLVPSDLAADIPSAILWGQEVKGSLWQEMVTRLSESKGHAIQFYVEGDMRLMVKRVLGLKS